MTEPLVPIALGAIILLPVAIFVWQLRRVRQGIESKAKGTILFFAYSILPVLLYIALFFVLVGIEALTGLAVINEGYARTVFVVVGIGTMLVLLMASIFGLLALLSKPRGKAT